jgi:hypothetical protein
MLTGSLHAICLVLTDKWLVPESVVCLPLAVLHLLNYFQSSFCLTAGAYIQLSAPLLLFHVGGLMTLARVARMLLRNLLLAAASSAVLTSTVVLTAASSAVLTYELVRGCDFCGSICCVD